MAWIAGSRGVFRLADSDEYCGSLIPIADACAILAVEAAAIAAIPQRPIAGELCVNELDLHRAWGRNQITGCPTNNVRGARRSLDELMLSALIKLVLPGALVEHQFPWDRRSIDLRVVHGGETKFIEFLGPSHFQHQYGRAPLDPRDRKRSIEDAFGVECVLWPYWIQRCASNVRALFDDSVQGKAAVWSTKSHFGDFSIPGAAAIIVELTNRFRALGLTELVTCRRPGMEVKPVHP